MGGGTSYTFVTSGIESAVKQARAVAGGQDVLLAGGVSIAQQALASGLVDEVILHVAPVLAGRGRRLFGGAQVDLRCMQTVHGEGAVHLRTRSGDHADGSFAGKGFRRERLHEVQLRVAGLVVNQPVAGRAVPAGLDRGAARGVAGRLRLIGVPGPPVRQQAERSG